MIPYFFMEVKCKGNTTITHMEETEKHHRVIRLILKDQNVSNKKES